MRRLVYSLEFELELFRPRTTHRLIVTVDPDGRSPYCRAHDRAKRVVDLVPGDWIVHNRRRFRIKAVAPFRSREIANDCGESRDGYVREA
jgi:hypothetical protein